MVTDRPRIAGTARALGLPVSAEVRVFAEEARPEAVAWIAEGA